MQAKRQRCGNDMRWIGRCVSGYTRQGARVIIINKRFGYHMGCRDDVNISECEQSQPVEKSIAHESEIDSVVNLNGGKHGWSLL